MDGGRLRKRKGAQQCECQEEEGLAMPALIIMETRHIADLKQVEISKFCFPRECMTILWLREGRHTQRNLQNRKSPLHSSDR
jgi:hypothetical protein